MPNNVKQQTQEIVELEYSHINVCVNTVAIQLKDKLPKHGTIVIYGIPRGGMIPAVILSHVLEKERSVRVVSSLDHLDPSDWHRLVIVDELVDSGDTIKSLKARFPEAITVALYQRYSAKNHADIIGCVWNGDDWLRMPWEQA